MVSHIDHVTIVVRDVEKAKEFFGLLGFADHRSPITAHRSLISGEKFEKYMGLDGIKAEHHTLVLTGASPRPALRRPGMEVQLLRYIDPKPIPDPNIATLREVGYNHICFAVDDIESELKRLTANGIKAKNDIMEFHDRRLVYLVGPEDITVELAEWV